MRETKTTSDSIKNTREYHERYLRAVNNPLRRELLKALKEGCTTIEDLQSKTGLDEDTLKWHLDVLEHDFCIEKEIKQGKSFYKLTQEGKVINYLK
ncbi:MAG: winged helix-turn-helix domain-containing protein [Candidatus Bathyarchaeota archaeon]|nr:winged helix-turn-helix domain-containing protein [Candidatus Bathyarchaeota archaeon]